MKRCQDLHCYLQQGCHPHPEIHNLSNSSTSSVQFTQERNQFSTCCRARQLPRYSNTPHRMFIINKLFRSIHNRLKYAACSHAHSYLSSHKSSVTLGLAPAPASAFLPNDFIEKSITGAVQHHDNNYIIDKTHTIRSWCRSGGVFGMYVCLLL